MKKNKLTIIIDKPVMEVYGFTTNPKNTSKWIDLIEIEKCSDWPIKIGTTYQNKGKIGLWSEYSVVNLIESQIFELVSASRNYHVRYTYAPIDQNHTEMEYFEWVDEGDIESPFSQDVLIKLKTVMEIK